MTIDQSSLIEGIGNEALIVAAIISVLFIILIVWVTKSINILPISLQQWLYSHNEPAIGNSVTSIESNELVTIQNPPNNSGDQGYDETEAIKKVIQPSINLVNDDQNNNSNDDNDDENNDNIPDGYIQIKIKKLDDSTKVINVDPAITITNFKWIHFKSDLQDNKNVRLIFNGKELKEINNSRLTDYNVVNGSTIHCLITKKKEVVVTQAPLPMEGPILSSDLHMGSLLFPLLGILLSFVWYYRLNYKQYFSVAASFVLIVLTLLYFVGCFFNYSTPPANPNFTNNPTTVDVSTSMN